MYSKNQKGRSQGALITEYHLGIFKKQQSDLTKPSTSSSPFIMGIFFTLIILGLTIIGKLYWKSRKIKKVVGKNEDKYNMESRCSLLKQDNFAV